MHGKEEDMEEVQGLQSLLGLLSPEQGASLFCNEQHNEEMSSNIKLPPYVLGSDEPPAGPQEW